MKVLKGSIWECIDTDSEYLGRLCIVREINDNPDFNGEGTIELLYANGDVYTGKVRRFSPGFTHKIRRQPKNTQRNLWMSEVRVKVYLDGKVVLSKDVRSKSSAMAIVNVLTNHYKGEVEKVEAEYLWKGTWSQ